MNLKKLISFFIIFTIAASIGCWLRMYPLAQRITYGSSEKATLYVLTQIRKQVVDDINRRFPEAPIDQRNMLIKRSFDEILKERGHKVRNTIKSLGKSLDDETPLTSHPHLLASDSYYYLNLTENIRDTGRIARTLKGSKYLNELMLAPIGHWEPFNLHPYVGYFVYKAISALYPDIHLITAVAYTPLVISVLALIPLFALCAMLGCSRLASVISAILFLSAPIFLKRSSYGWYDNDPYNTLFPALILSVIFYSLRKACSSKKQIMLAVLTVIMISVYSFFWHGWGFFLGVIFASAVLILIANHFVFKGHETKRYIFTFGIIIGGTVLGISLAFGPAEFFILIQEGWEALSNFLKPRLSAWPDMYIGVGELRKAPFIHLLGLCGGLPVFVVALLGMFSSLYTSIRSHDKGKTFSVIFLAVFFALALLISFGAQRFTLFIITPLYILFPIGLDFIFKHSALIFKAKFPGKIYETIFPSIIVWLIAFVLLFAFVKKRYLAMPQILNPLFNDTWEQSLIYIRDNTPEESIINSWWPPGHFIKAISKRRVTFDGATINIPQGYWMSNVLLANDEREAVGILRMLNNSANTAAEYLELQGFKLSEVVRTLKHITKLNQAKAKTYLKENLKLTDQKSAHVVSLTHKKPPPSYYYVWNGMIDSNVQFKFFGHWNFEKIEELNSSPEKLKIVPPRGSKEFIQFLWELAGGTMKFSGVLGELARKENLVKFEEGITVDIAAKNVLVNSEKYGKGIPISILYIENNEVIEKMLPNSNLNYSLILQENGKVWRCVLLDRKLAKSVLMQLYFFEGKDLKYFELVNKNTDLTQRTVIQIFKIDWDKFLADLTD